VSSSSGIYSAPLQDVAYCLASPDWRYILTPDRLSASAHGGAAYNPLRC